MTASINIQAQPSPFLWSGGIVTPEPALFVVEDEDGAARLIVTDEDGDSQLQVNK